jgi:signal transduction histidine kinase
MQQQVLIVHSQTSVIADVLGALDQGPHQLTVSTEPNLTETLCEKYRPDLLIMDWDPDGFGGIEAFQALHDLNPEMLSIGIAPGDVQAVPSEYVRNGLRSWHQLPIKIDQLRKQVERCLWVAQPKRTLVDLSRDIDERASHLDTFLSISRSITANLRNDLDTLLEQIAEETSRMLVAERTSLFIFDRAHDCLWSRVAEGEVDRTITLGMDQPGIVVHVAKTGQPLQVQDAYREPLFNPDVDRITGYHTRNILGFPVRNDRGELIGVIETLNKISGPFTDSDERLLAIMSFLFAAAIENAQLYEALRQQIRENESLESQKIQADRLAVVGQMASSIIHDIRGPLAIIRGYAELAVAGTESTEKRQRFANTITAEVSRLHDMARDLQEYSDETSSVALIPTAIEPFIESFLELIRPDFSERSIHIIHHLQYEGNLMMDAGRMKRAFHNISANAADAMASGGSFMVTSSQVGEHVHIELHDTGAGVPDDIQDRLFEPFVTSGKTHGTGLGLAVVNRIIHEHQAEITVATSTTGTTFTIRFPVPMEGT